MVQIKVQIKENTEPLNRVIVISNTVMTFLHDFLHVSCQSLKACSLLHAFKLFILVLLLMVKCLASYMFFFH